MSEPVHPVRSLVENLRQSLQGDGFIHLHRDVLKPLQNVKDSASIEDAGRLAKLLEQNHKALCYRLEPNALNHVLQVIIEKFEPSLKQERLVHIIKESITWWPTTRQNKRFIEALEKRTLTLESLDKNHSLACTTLFPWLIKRCSRPFEAKQKAAAVALLASTVCHFHPEALVHLLKDGSDQPWQWLAQSVATSRHVTYRIIAADLLRAFLNAQPDGSSPWPSTFDTKPWDEFPRRAIADRVWLQNLSNFLNDVDLTVGVTEDDDRPQIFYLRQLEVPDRLSTTEDDFVVSSIDKQNVIFIVPASHETPLQYLEAPLTTFEDIELEDEETDPLRSTCVKLCATKSGYTVQDGAKRALSWLRVVPLANPQQAIALLCNYIQPTRHPLFNLLTGNKGEPSDITGKHGQIQVSDSQVKQTEALELSLLQMKDPIDVTASSPDYTPHKSMTAINQDDEAPKISDIDIRRSLEGFARDAGKAYSQSLIRSKSSEIMHPQVRPEHQAEDGDKAEDSCPFPNDASLANLMAKRQYQILQPFDHEEKLLQMLPTKTGGATVSSSNLHLKEFRDQGQENDRQLVDSGHEARGNFPGEVSSDARLHTGQTSGRAGQQPTALPSQMLLMKSSRGLNKDQRIQNEASKATKPKKSEPESAETGIALSEWDLSDDVQEPDISSEGKRRLLRPRIHKVVQQRRREDPMAKSTMTTKSRVVKSTKKTTYKQPLRQKRFRAAKAEKNYREAQDDDIQDEDRRNQNMSKATYNPVKIAIPPDKTTSLASVLDDGTEPRAEDPDSEKERSTLSAMNYGQLAQLDSVDEDPAAKPTSKKDSLSLRENPESIVIAAPLKEQNTVTKPDTSYNNMLFGEIENVRILATGSNGAVNAEGRVSDRDRDHSNNVKGSEDTDTKSTHITVLVPTDLTTVALPETPVNHFYTQNTNQEHMDLDAKQPTVVHFGRTSVGRSSLRTQASDSFASGSIIAARKSALGEIRPHNEYKKRLHRLGNMTAADGEAPPAERRHLKRCSNTNLPSIDLDDSDPGIMDESDISSKRSSAKISKFSLGRNEGAPSREVSTVDPRNVFPPQQSFETCVHTPVSKLPSMVERNVVVESSNVRGSDQRPGLHSEQFGSAKRTHPAIEAQVTLLTSPSNPILPVSENEPAIAIVPKTETAVHTRFGDQEEEQGPSGTQIALVHERRSAPTPIAIAGNSPKTPEQCPANVDESPRRLSIQEPVFTRTEIDSDIWGTTIPPVQSPLITLRTTRRLERATIFREPDTRIPRSRSTVATHSAAVINSEAPEISLPKRVKSPPMASLSPSHGISSKLAVPASPIATLKSSARRQPNAIGVVKEPAMESSTVPTITPVPSSTTLPLAASNFFSSSSSFGRSNPEDLSEALGRPITSRSPRIVHFEGEPRPTNQIFAPARCSQSHPSKYSFKNSRRSNTEFPSILSEISSNKPQTNSSHYHIDSNTSSQIKLRSALSVNHKSDRMTETQSPVSRPSALERHSPTDLAKQSKSTKAAGSPGVGDEFGSVVPRRILGRYRSESPAIKSPAQSITSDASFFTQFRQQNLTPESAGHDEKQSTRLSLSIPDDNLEDETTIVEPDSLEREMQNKNKENNSSSSNDSITFSEVDAVKPHRKRSDGLQMLNHEQKWDSFYEIFKLMAEELAQQLEDNEKTVIAQYKMFDNGARAMVETMIHRQEDEATKQRESVDPDFHKLRKLCIVVQQRSKVTRRDAVEAIKRLQVAPTTVSEQTLQDLARLEEILGMETS